MVDTRSSGGRAQPGVEVRLLSAAPQGCEMHSRSRVEQALILHQQGIGARRIARHLSVPVSTVRDWLARSGPAHSRPGDPAVARCCPGGGLGLHEFELLTADYVYLLGLYLGDGCISQHRRGVYRLRLAVHAKYPGIVDSAVRAMSAVRSNRVSTQLRPQNYVEVSGYWKCWPWLFPQHGPGKKHERSLTGWQNTLVDRWPDHLLRGPIHSDGRRLQNSGTNWSWPRYSFSQVSDDIRTVFCDACDRLGLHWTEARTTIYVSRKRDVAILDEFIGPKR